jgi:hypothetical protein
MVGNEALLDHDGTTGRATHGDGVPVVLDANLGLGDEQQAVFGSLAVGQVDHGADGNPVCPFDAAEEPPSSAEQKAAVDDLRSAHRGNGVDHERIPVGHPDVLLQVQVGVGQIPLVDAQDLKDPGQCGHAGSEGPTDLDVHRRGHLVSPETSRPQQLDQARVDEHLHRGIRKAAVAVGDLGVLLCPRDDLGRLLDESFA